MSPARLESHPSRPVARSRWWWASSLVGYALIFGLLMRPWLANISHSVSAGHDRRDTRLVIWILWWVQSSLFGTSHDVYDAPIFFPASAQLTGSEHFLSSQLLFAPSFALSHNAILSANIVAIASYPLAAFALQRLLSKWGLWGTGAWLAGLVFALGPLRVPASLQVLQYLNLYLPLSLLALIALLERPAGLRWTICTIVLCAGLFSSYYMAAQILIVGIVWIAAQAVGAHVRLRRLGPLLGAILVATAMLAVCSSPYFLRRRSIEADLDVASSMPHRAERATALTLDQMFDVANVLLHSWSGADYLPVALAVLALPATVLGIRRKPLRLISVFGFLLSVIGILLASGYAQATDGPVAAFVGFFRFKIRFLVLAGFGLSILCAVFLHLVHEWLPRSAYCVTAGLGGLVVVATLPVVVPRLDRPRALSTDRFVYDEIRELGLMRAGGALLELPWRDGKGQETSPDAMAGATIHGLPLVNGYTGYFPSHWPLLRDVLSRLPAREAIDDLAEMTHVRWIVLRPPEEWQDVRQREQLEDALKSLSPSPERWELGGWSIHHLSPSGWRHPERFNALQGHVEKDQTILGTPLISLPRDETDGVLTVRSSSRVRRNSILRLPVEVSNRGRHIWPVSKLGRRISSRVVHLRAEWRSADARGLLDHIETCRLPRDVYPAETLEHKCWLTAPSTAGTYRLDIRLVQADTDAFESSEGVGTLVTVTP